MDTVVASMLDMLDACSATDNVEWLRLSHSRKVTTTISVLVLTRKTNHFDYFAMCRYTAYQSVAISFCASGSVMRPEHTSPCK